MKDEVKEYIDTLDLGRSQAIQFMSCACGNLLHSTAAGKRGEGRVVRYLQLPVGPELLFLVRSTWRNRGRPEAATAKGFARSV